MARLPCIRLHMLGQPLKTIITLTNNLTDFMFDESLYFGPSVWIDLQ